MTELKRLCSRCFENWCGWDEEFCDDCLWDLHVPPGYGVKSLYYGNTFKGDSVLDGIAFWCEPKEHPFEIEQKPRSRFSRFMNFLSVIVHVPLVWVGCEEESSLEKLRRLDE